MVLQALSALVLPEQLLQQAPQPALQLIPPRLRPQHSQQVVPLIAHLPELEPLLLLAPLKLQLRRLTVTTFYQ